METTRFRLRVNVVSLMFCQQHCWGFCVTGCDGCVVRWAVRSLLKECNVFPSGSGNRLLAPLYPEDGGIMILQNILELLARWLGITSQKDWINIVSYLENTIIKWTYCGQNVSVLSVCLWYVSTEWTGGCFAKIIPKFCGNTSLFTKNHQQKLKMN